MKRALRAALVLEAAVLAGLLILCQSCLDWTDRRQPLGNVPLRPEKTTSLPGDPYPGQPSPQTGREEERGAPAQPETGTSASSLPLSCVKGPRWSRELLCEPPEQEMRSECAPSQGKLTESIKDTSSRSQFPVLCLSMPPDNSQRVQRGDVIPPRSVSMSSLSACSGAVFTTVLLPSTIILMSGIGGRKPQGSVLDVRPLEVRLRCPQPRGLSSSAQRALLSPEGSPPQPRGLSSSAQRALLPSPEGSPPQPRGLSSSAQRALLPSPEGSPPQPRGLSSSAQRALLPSPEGSPPQPRGLSPTQRALLLSPEVSSAQRALLLSPEGSPPQPRGLLSPEVSSAQRSPQPRGHLSPEMVPGLRQNLSLQGWMQSQPEEAECFPLRLFSGRRFLCNVSSRGGVREPGERFARTSLAAVCGGLNRGDGREVGVYNSSVRFNGSHSIFPVTLSEKENEPKGHRGTPLSSLSGAHRRQPGRATPAKTTVPRLEL
ncbi:unnamed protein product [Gadus morhua 'NCC']